MQNVLIPYFCAAFGSFMSYIFAPTFDDGRARVIFERLFWVEGKERVVEWLLFLINVFGGAFIAVVFTEPSTPKMAVAAGLGWTSLASIARTAYSVSTKGLASTTESEVKSQTQPTEVSQTVPKEEPELKRKKPPTRSKGRA